MHVTATLVLGGIGTCFSCIVIIWLVCTTCRACKRERSSDGDFNASRTGIVSLRPLMSVNLLQDGRIDVSNLMPTYDHPRWNMD